MVWVNIELITLSIVLYSNIVFASQQRFIIFLAHAADLVFRRIDVGRGLGGRNNAKLWFSLSSVEGD
jgi:hypothetical protein